jgi:hypothetical protein
MEAAISWEFASNSTSGLPVPIETLIRESNYGLPTLIFAVAEHKVDLPGGTAASQTDVWAVVQTPVGMLSLTVEAKAKESFGNETLKKWLVAGATERSINNRKMRWDYVRSHLPKSDSFLHIRYQLLHRCAASVIEARRLRFQHAAFIVQAFDTPAHGFQDYAAFCQSLGIGAARGSMATVPVDEVSLSIGWVDCPIATLHDMDSTA